jgi:hypothetical protein
MAKRVERLLHYYRQGRHDTHTRTQLLLLMLPRMRALKREGEVEKDAWNTSKSTPFSTKLQFQFGAKVRISWLAKMKKK